MPPDIVVDDPGIGQDAALIVVGSLEELERLASYLPESDLSDDVRGADLSQNWIVVVFRGAMPTAGYGVEIETVPLTATVRSSSRSASRLRAPRNSWRR